MSLYHIVFLLLLGGTLFEHYCKKTPKWLYCITFSALTVMLCLRFGQGSDYSAYSMIYYTMPTNIAGVMTWDAGKAEIGWRLLCMVFRKWDLSFPVFVAAVSLLEMAMIGRFVNRFCERKMLALFLSYHTLYLTYCFSAMRQGVVIAVFLGLLLQWLLDGKYLRYCVGVALCCSIHTVALVLLIPLVIRGIRLTVEQIVALVAVGACVGLLLSIFGIGNLLAMLGMNYAGESDISLVALAERACTFVLVSYMYHIYLGGQEPDQKDPLFQIYKFYAFGILLYGLLMWSPLISSRTIFVLKILEVPLICTCIGKCRKAANIAVLYCVAICSLLYVKNISSYITQQMYLKDSVWEYPYVSVFDKERAEKIRSKDAPFYEWLIVDQND